MPVFVLHHASWKLCVCWYLRFAALLSQHRLVQAIVLHGLHSPAGRNKSVSLECFPTRNSAKWASLPVFHHCSPTISIAETVYGLDIDMGLFTRKLVRQCDHPTVLQHNTAARQFGVQSGTRSTCNSSSLLARNSMTTSKRSVVYSTFLLRIPARSFAEHCVLWC